MTLSPVDLELGYRYRIVAVEAQATAQPFTLDTAASSADGFGGPFVWGVFGGLKLAPIEAGRWDLSAALRVGYMEVRGPEAAPRGDLSLGAALNVDVFLTRAVALGFSLALYTPPDDVDNPPGLLAQRLSLILYRELLDGGSATPPGPDVKRPSH